MKAIKKCLTSAQMLWCVYTLKNLPFPPNHIPYTLMQQQSTALTN